MSDTPRTDKAVWEDDGGEQVRAEFARQLERELALWKSRAEQIYGNAYDGFQTPEGWWTENDTPTDETWAELDKCFGLTTIERQSGVSS